MKISRIEVANFRCFSEESSVVELPQGLISIVGENNAGKSALLDVVKSAVETPDHNLVDIADIPIERPDSFPSTLVVITLTKDEVKSIFHELYAHELQRNPGLLRKALPAIHKKFSTKITIRKHLESPGTYVAEFLLGDFKLQGRRAFLRSPANQLDAKQFLAAMDEPKSPAADNFENSGAVMFDDDIQAIVTRLISSRFIPTSDIRVRPSNDGRLGVEIERSFDGSQTANFLLNLKNGDGRSRAIFHRIQEVFAGFFPGFSPEVTGRAEREVQLVFNRQNSTQDVDQEFVGTGVVEVLTTITHLVGLESSVFVLEEPESHLHRLSQAALMQLLKLSATKNQVIVLTHSPTFIDLSNQNSIVMVRRQQSGSKCSIVPVARSAGAKEAFIDALSATQAADLLFARAALLVEGPTEVEFLKNLGARIGLDLEASGVAIVDVGSDSRFSSYIQICHSLGIPIRCLQDLDRGAAKGEYSDLFTVLGMEIEDYWKSQGLKAQLEAAAAEVGSHRENKIRFGRWLGNNLEPKDVPNLFIKLMGQMIELARPLDNGR